MKIGSSKQKICRFVKHIQSNSIHHRTKINKQFKVKLSYDVTENCEMLFPPDDWFTNLIRIHIDPYAMMSWFVKWWLSRNNDSFNPLKTKRRLLYLKIQFVLRSKHFSSRLWKPISLCCKWHKSLFVLTHKYSVGGGYSCWMLNCWCITWPVGFKRLKSQVVPLSKHFSCRL